MADCAVELRLYATFAQLETDVHELRRAGYDLQQLSVVGRLPGSAGHQRGAPNGSGHVRRRHPLAFLQRAMLGAELSAPPASEPLFVCGVLVAALVTAAAVPGPTAASSLLPLALRLLGLDAATIRRSEDAIGHGQIVLLLLPTHRFGKLPPQPALPAAQNPRPRAAGLSYHGLICPETT